MRLFYNLPNRTPVSLAAPALKHNLPADEARLGNEADFDTDLEGWFFRNRRNILIILISSILVLGLVLRLLAPALSSSLADNLPSNWTRSSSEHVLAVFDSGPLQVSLVPEDAHARLRSRFAGLTAPGEGAPPYRLIFRHSNTSAPLLFSLPSGDIVVTDRFFSSIQNADQQIALLCQELGHLQHQHSLRVAVHHNLIWLASAAFVGSTDRSIGALNDGLLHSDYALNQLSAADRYAQTILQANGFPHGLLASTIAQHGENTAPGRLLSPEGQPAYREERLHALQQTRP